MTGNQTFQPRSITIKTFDEVKWVNTSNIAHTVTAYEEEIPDVNAYFASGEFVSEGIARTEYPDGEIQPGETYYNPFEVPGTYEYFCIPHEDAGMTGTIEVLPR